MFSWIGRGLIFFFIIFFFVSKAYSVDRIPLVEFHYGDKAYPMVYRPQLPARYIGQNFLRGISRFAIPIGVGYLLYDLYKQYQKWTEFLNQNVLTYDWYYKLDCVDPHGLPFYVHMALNFQGVSGPHSYVREDFHVKVTYKEASKVCFMEPYYRDGSTGDKSYPVYEGTIKDPYYKYIYSSMQLLRNPPIEVIYIHRDGSKDVIPATKIGDLISNSTLKKPVEDIVSDVDKSEPFSNTSPQLVDKIDPTTTTIIPDEYVDRDILPIKNENMTTNATRQWNETTTISNSTSNETGNLTNTTETTTTGSEDLSFQYEKPGPGFIQDLLNFFKNIRLPIPSISGSGQCSFIIQVPFGKLGVLDFCQFHNLFQVIGNILVAMSGFISIYVLYKNS